jgi:hypothetical protein
MWQHGYPSVRAFAIVDGDLMIGKVEIFYP